VLTSANTAGLDLDQHIVVAELFLMSVLVLVPREKDLFTFGRGTVTTPYSSGLVYLHGRVLACLHSCSGLLSQLNFANFPKLSSLFLDSSYTFGFFKNEAVAQRGHSGFWNFLTGEPSSPLEVWKGLTSCLISSELS
jgi:hypothetical protein